MPDVFNEYTRPKYPGFACSTPSATQKSYAGECDINAIMAKVTKGVPISVNTAAPLFADFSQIPDFQTAQNRIAEALTAFQQLPADLRFRFKNNPQNLIDFVLDSKNRAEAIAIGLVAPDPVVPVAPASTEAVK